LFGNPAVGLPHRFHLRGGAEPNKLKAALSIRVAKQIADFLVITMSGVNMFGLSIAAFP
jgi:hypothetical protein